MKRSYLLALGALCSAMVPAAAVAQPNAAANAPWLFLGARNIASGTEHETVEVTSERLLRQLQFCVFNTPLRLETLSIQFEDGQRQEVPVQERIVAGGCTRAIDLTGASRRVRAVDLTYGSVFRFRRAPMVRIVGR
ncbi:hypothetical protein WBP06_17420 [Novosphingobium sp. BL-8H]|uniref:hypothetical protein n=1 Tax=Novosphingobium sp. BL-8H TaxID=3127640 RepID=UPI0037580BB6